MTVADNSQTASGRAGNRANVDDFAAYVFDMLQSLREASQDEKYKFMAYLMGLAAEEAIRLAEGQPSAAAPRRTHSRRHPAKRSG